MTQVDTGGGDYVSGGKREVATGGGTYIENLTISGGALSTELNTLIGLLMQQEARASIAVFGDRLARASVCIQSLTDYKRLHENLHNLQFQCLNPIVQGSRSFPDYPPFLDSLPDYIDTFDKVLINVRALVRRLPFNEGDLRWVKKLEHSFQLLNDALTTRSRPQLDKACVSMSSVIGQRQEEMNQSLKLVARELLDLGLVGAVTAVRDELALRNASAELRAQYDRGIAMLSAFGASLRSQVDAHDRWQEVESVLRTVEVQPEARLADTWLDLAELIEPIVADAGDEKVVTFRKSADRLRDTLGAGSAGDIQSAFKPFRRQAGLCFYGVDRRLLDLCEQLERVHPQLQQLVLGIQTTPR